ncbi:hypothetical protein IQ06DRAFT_227470 [Phaeosphaeriaceae sp. SRC1lsM3a]|nr:hypothetical protein IQ06DRAFT_227470 [Stagonospora sp. SRC1lsM3a]
MASNAPKDLGQPLVLENFMPIEQPVDINSAALCVVCYVVPEQTKRCGRCKDIMYCSNNGQTPNWAEHKMICKSFPKSTSPDLHHRHALYCAPAESRPSFVWLQYGDDGKPIDIVKCFANTP